MKMHEGYAVCDKYDKENLLFLFQRTNRTSLMLKEFDDPEDAVRFILSTKLPVRAWNRNHEAVNKRIAFFCKLQSKLGGRKKLLDYILCGKI